MSVLAFIPARAGSKGIPGKNLVKLNYKPLIQYTLEAAQKSKCIDEIFVSTNDPDIIDLSESLGIPVHYVRPDSLAEDETPMIDAILHGISWMKGHLSEPPTDVVLLQPTSPLRTENDIDTAYHQFKEQEMDSLVSVHEMNEHPYECIQIDQAGWKFLAKSEGNPGRRQEYENGFYFINGAIYIAQIKRLIEEKKFLLKDNTGFYIMRRERGVDIDDWHDLKYAEFLLRENAD